MSRLWIVLCLMAVPAAPVPAWGDVGGRADVHVPTQEADGLAALLPKEAIAFVSVRDVPGFLRKLEQLPVVKILLKEGFLEKLLPPGALRRAQGFYEAYVKPLGGILRGELAFSLTHLDLEGDESPGMLLIADIGGREAAVKRYLEEAVYPWADGSGVLARSTVKVDGTPFTRIGPAGFQDEGPVLGVKDGLFLLALPPHHNELLGKGLDRARDESLAANPWFTKVEEALSGADFIEYINLGAVDRRQLDRCAAGGWKDEYDCTWGAFHAISGFEPLEAAGMGMALGPDGGWTTVCLLGDGPHGGIAGILARKPGPLKSLAYLDDETAVYLAIRAGGFSQLYADLVGIIARHDATVADGIDRVAAFKQAVGSIGELLDMDIEKALLPAFGGEVAIAGWIPGGLEVPPCAALIEIKDKKTIAAFVDRVLEFLPDVAGIPFEPERATYEGVEIVSLKGVPQVVPAVAIVGDFLVVASKPSVIENIVDTLAEGPHLGQAEGYKRYVSSIPGDAAITLYVDVKRIADFAWPIFLERMGAGPAPGPGPDMGPGDKAVPGGVSMLGALVMGMGELRQALSPMGMKVIGNEDGITITSRSANGGFGVAPFLMGTVAGRLYFAAGVRARGGFEGGEFEEEDFEVEEDDVGDF